MGWRAGGGSDAPGSARNRPGALVLRIALDTNRYVDLARGHEPVREIVESASEVTMPFIVLAELRAGFAMGTHRLANEERLAAFLRQPGVSVLWADDATLNQYAAVVRQMRTQGTPVPTNDVWIAALALRHGAALLTRDHHFSLIPQLSLV